MAHEIILALIKKALSGDVPAIQLLWELFCDSLGGGRQKSLIFQWNSAKFS
jgi:hypothetical protein